jgi:hypothetical protein
MLDEAGALGLCKAGDGVKEIERRRRLMLLDDGDVVIELNNY